MTKIDSEDEVPEVDDELDLALKLACGHEPEDLIEEEEGGKAYCRICREQNRISIPPLDEHKAP